MQLYEDRRALHRIPEIALHLPKTVQYVTETLEKGNCRVFSPMDSAVCAFFDFGADSAIAFRADMDALGMEEKTGLPFSSEHPGRMHACGHDGHTAILLEFARRLETLQLDVNVLLVFQPGEEGPGGAKALCDTGVLEKYHVKAVFGLHLWPGLEKGAVYSRKGAMMSRSSEVTVTVTGRSAHIGKADQALDALAACTLFYTRATKMEQAMDPAVFRLLKFGRMEAGTVRNVIAGTARLEGSLRAFDDGVFDTMKEALCKIARQVEKETGCGAIVHLSESYPALCNPAELYDRVQKFVKISPLEQPSMTSEDFSWYQRRVPGMFFFLGVGDTPALHADTFDFDETVLLQGVELFEKIVENYR